jgi:hypothetical protein
MLIQILFFDLRKPAASLERWARARLPSLERHVPSVPTTEAASAKPGALAPVPLGTLLLGLIPVVYLGTITLALEEYPVTTWPMYSDRTESTRVQYILFHGLDGAGRKVPVQFEDEFGVLGFNRTYDVVPLAFHGRDEEREPLRRVLDAFAELHDRDRPPSERLAAFRFELRAWDYDRDPDDPNRGVTVSTFVHHVGSATAQNE